LLLAGIGALDSYLQTAQRMDLRWGTQSPNLVEFFANRQQLNLLFTSREFHLAGASYDESYQFVGPSFPCDTQAFDLPLGFGPLIYISLGTIFNHQADFYRACFKAFGGKDCRVILATGNRIGHDELGAPPSNFTLHRHAPQIAVLRHADAFLTHGGMNSTSEALWHGVPLLVFPQHGDQHLVAARVAELGAGLVMRPPDASPERLHALTSRLLEEPCWRDAARRVGQTFRSAGGPARAAAEILAWRSRS
jgi:MGT family glycosyltransferase